MAVLLTGFRGVVAGNRGVAAGNRVGVSAYENCLRIGGPVLTPGVGVPSTDMDGV